MKTLKSFALATFLLITGSSFAQQERMENEKIVVDKVDARIKWNTSNPSDGYTVNEMDLQQIEATYNKWSIQDQSRIKWSSSNPSDGYSAERVKWSTSNPSDGYNTEVIIYFVKQTATSSVYAIWP